ncbi:thiol reductant ABC exporter subunit CydC, partial [Pseudoalteromonas sp. S326]
QYNQQLYSRIKEIANRDGITMLRVQLAMLGAIVSIVPLGYSGAMVFVEFALFSLYVLASFETVLLLPKAFIELPCVL